MVAPKRQRTAADYLLMLASGAMVVIVLISWFISARYAEVDWDAGYYASLARLTARGYVPFLDFPSVYPPGVYYLLAVLGESGLSDPLLLRAYVCAFHSLNALLFFLLLRTLGLATRHALFWCCVFLLWVLQLDGTDVVLEPFQQTFLLAGMLGILRLDGWRGALVGGLSVGCALLVKQYTLLALPGVLMVATAPTNCISEVTRPEAPLPASSQGSSHGRDSTWRGFRRALVLLAVLPVPYLLFALTTRQRLPENIWHLATFGGRAFDSAATGGIYVAQGPLAGIGTIATGGYEFQLILAVIAAGVLLAVLQSSRLVFGIILCFALPLAQLAVRPYPHYLQVCIPWGVVVLAVLAQTIARYAGNADSRSRLEGALTFVTALAFFGLAIIALSSTRVTYLEAKLRDQLELAASIQEALPQSNDVVVMNGPWLYLLAELNPPGHEHRFVNSPNDALLSKASYAVMLPAWRFPFDESRRQLEGRGFAVIASVPWRSGEALVLRNSRYAKGN